MAQPTAREQYLLELVNRARKDPTAEAARQGVDLQTDLKNGKVISTGEKQAVAFNEALISGAQDQAQWMIDNDTLAHNGDLTPVERLDKYNWDRGGEGAWGENVGMFATSGAITDKQAVDQLHAGLYKSSDHRYNMFGDWHEEAGFGVAQGDWAGMRNGFATTEMFGSTEKTYLLGVAYNDKDGDQFYTPGEGRAGIKVVAVNRDTGETFTTTTWDAGGYQMEVERGRYEVTFSGGDLASPVTTRIDVGDQNEKLDLINRTAVDQTGDTEFSWRTTYDGQAGDGGANPADRIETGTSAADSFTHMPEDGWLEIRDFDTNADSLTIATREAGYFDNIAELVAERGWEFNGNAAITLDASTNDIIVFEGLSLSQLAAAKNVNIVPPVSAEAGRWNPGQLLQDNAAAPDFIDGGDGAQTFAIAGDSAGYGWGPTQDGSGIVVWSGDKFDILYNVEFLKFDDRMIDLKTGEQLVFNREGVTDYVTGGDGKDGFAINGKSTDYGWAETQDGTGIVVWNDKGHDILWDVEQLVFTDTVVDLPQDG